MQAIHSVSTPATAKARLIIAAPTRPVTHTNSAILILRFVYRMPGVLLPQTGT